MNGLPELEKKDFAAILTNASPLGRVGLRWARGSDVGTGAWDPPLSLA